MNSSARFWLGLLDKTAHMESGIVPGVVGGLDVAIAVSARVGSMPSTTILSAAAATASSFAAPLRKRGSIADHVVGGKDAQHRVGVLALDEESSQSAGGAVLRATGSWTICPAGMPFNWSAISAARYSFSDHPGLVQPGPAA